ncbi:hypothetical protein K504DRAFT_182647 [Pleomassaria siparia CBS 279.74]|uniref:Uncharacterized protein n=1 Tax=Pleomassaria siparia CBS 279.74 TaxID=1314801 RepID=A0A6G1JS52_9PLEO|nr:hypothetical protein K504DRAFT_182647 [Pleomassaria siparia CBS 279.74]
MYSTVHICIVVAKRPPARPTRRRMSPPCMCVCVCVCEDIPSIKFCFLFCSFFFGILLLYPRLMEYRTGIVWITVGNLINYSIVVLSVSFFLPWAPQAGAAAAAAVAVVVVAAVAAAVAAERQRTKKKCSEWVPWAS